MAELGNAAESALLHIEVVYALPERQEVVSLRLPPGSTVRQAVEASGLLARYPQIDLTRNRLGIYSRLITPETPLRDRDRVEIYRPLLADPKEVRRQRAVADKQRKLAQGRAAQTALPGDEASR
jgi:putative ubiquitin-RnfH superfamily antitoxin RatB of RatAB toxin-antitoxin module